MLPLKLTYLLLPIAAAELMLSTPPVSVSLLYAKPFFSFPNACALRVDRSVPL
jgi:hypothetical protein